MRAQLWEQTLKDIVKIIDTHMGDPLATGTHADRKDHSNDRVILAKIRRMADKAVER